MCNPTNFIPYLLKVKHIRDTQEHPWVPQICFTFLCALDLFYFSQILNFYTEEHQEKGLTPGSTLNTPVFLKLYTLVQQAPDLFI